MADLFTQLAGRADATFEIGGVTFEAAPVTLEDYGAAQACRDAAQESERVAEHLRIRLRDRTTDPATLTAAWYDAQTPDLDHGTVMRALVYGTLETPHPTGKGKSLFRLQPGRAEDTFSVNGVRFYAATYTRAEKQAYGNLGEERKLLDVRADFFSARLRSRLVGTTHDPATITPAWYLGLTERADDLIEYLLLSGEMPGTAVPAQKKKNPLTDDEDLKRLIWTVIGVTGWDLAAIRRMTLPQLWLVLEGQGPILYPRLKFQLETQWANVDEKGIRDILRRDQDARQGLQPPKPTKKEQDRAEAFGIQYAPYLGMRRGVVEADRKPQGKSIPSLPPETARAIVAFAESGGFPSDVWAEFVAPLWIGITATAQGEG